MKARAYIAIFLMLYPSFLPVFGGSQTAVKKLMAGLNKTKPTATASKKGQPKKYKELEWISTSIQKPGNRGDADVETGSDNDSSSSNSDTAIKSSTPNNSGNRSPGSKSTGVDNGMTNPGTKTPGEDSPERKLPPQNQGNNSGGGSQGQSFGLWWPVCVFVDGPDANSQIAEMVKMSADCQVNLVPYVRTVTVPDPNNPEQLNSLQSQSCNIKEAGIAGKGSSLVLTNRSSTVADEMCGSIEPDGKGGTKPSTNVAGCNQLANGASGKAKTRAEGHKGNGDGFGGMAKGEVAVGIVDSEGYKSGAVYSHETRGHGQMGWPNGKKAGNGIGDPNDDKDSSGDHQHGGGYTGIGCAQMRASAIADPEGYHKYYASKTKYYSHRPDHPMPLGEQIWKTYKDGPKTNGQIAKNQSGSPRGADESSPSSKGADLGTAGPGHKNPLSAGGSTSARKGGRVGEAGSTKERNGGTNRGDGSSDGIATQVTGDPSDGPGIGSSTIVASKDKSLLSKPDSNGENSSNGGSSIMDSNYLEGFNPSDLVAGAANSSPNSRESTLTLNKSNGGDSDMDPDYLSDKKSKKSRRERRRDIRRGTAENQTPGNVFERAPASRREKRRMSASE